MVIPERLDLALPRICGRFVEYMAGEESPAPGFPPNRRFSILRQILLTESVYEGPTQMTTGSGGRMNFYRTGASRRTTGIVVVLVLLVVAAGAYLALGFGGGPGITTTTSTNEATTTTTEAAPSINGCGGTLATPLMTYWIRAYASIPPHINVSYATEGSTMGIAYTAQGLCQFGLSDAPLTAAQYAALPSGSTLLTIPISDSGVIPAYNIPGITAHLNFTGNVLAEIFYGTITQWNDPRIASLNPQVGLPAHAIQVYHGSDSRGSTYAFTQYLSDSNSTWRTKVGYATSVNWPTGIGCLHNDGVANCIAYNQYSIGPLEFAYEVTNPGQINYGAVQNRAGNFSLANLHTIQLATNAAVKNGLPTSPSQWSSFSEINNIFNDSTDANIYPIITFTYALIYQNLSASYAYMTRAQAVATANFLWWVVNSGQKPGAFLGYSALPPSDVTFDDQVLSSISYDGNPAYTGS